MPAASCWLRMIESSSRSESEPIRTYLSSGMTRSTLARSMPRSIGYSALSPNLIITWSTA